MIAALRSAATYLAVALKPTGHELNAGRSTETREMFQYFEAGDRVETTVDEGQGEHGRADARGGGGLGERGWA